MTTDTQSEIERVHALRKDRKSAEHLAAARALVANAPESVLAQIEAAYGHDREGLEEQALVHYEIAAKLGVPESERRHFFVGYGSTLRNCGRATDAIALFEDLLAKDNYPPYTAFLALALSSAERPREALATMMRCTLDVARENEQRPRPRKMGHGR